MRGILIACSHAVDTSVIKEVDINIGSDITHYVGCTMFDNIGLTWRGYDVTVFFDDEGLIKPNKGRLLQGAMEPLFGNLIIMGAWDNNREIMKLPDVFTPETIQDHITGVMFETPRGI